MTESNEAELKRHVWPGGITAITLFVEDLSAARAFYATVFGLPVVFEDDNSTVFKFRDTMINLLAVAAAPELVEPARVASPTAGARAVFTLDVVDVDVKCAELVARGVTLINGPMNRPWGIRTASFADPGGHIWEISQPL